MPEIIPPPLTPDNAVPLICCDAAVILLAGIGFMLLAPGAGRSWSGFYYLTPFLCGAVAALILAHPEILPGLWGLRFGVFFIGLATATGWQAIRLVAGQPVHYILHVVLCLIMLAFSSLAGSTGLLQRVNHALWLILIAGFHFAAARDVRKAGSTATPASIFLFRLLIFYGFVIILCMVLSPWLPQPLGSAPTALWAIVTYNALAVTKVFGVIFLLIALSREQISARHRSLAMQDTLTMIGNRRAMDEWISQHASDRDAFAVLLADIDHFKAVNDTYGHAAGDAVLMALASAGRRLTGSQDVFFRIGGEEFVIILRNRTEQEIIGFAETFRDIFREHSHKADSRIFTVTLSIGICSGFLSRFSDVFARADKALYAAKRSGRNRVVLYSDDQARTSDEAAVPSGDFALTPEKTISVDHQTSASLNG